MTECTYTKADEEIFQSEYRAAIQSAKQDIAELLVYDHNELEFWPKKDERVFMDRLLNAINLVREDLVKWAKGNDLVERLEKQINFREVENLIQDMWTGTGSNVDKRVVGDLLISIRSLPDELRGGKFDEPF
jgi:hypothetical protein